MSYTVISKQDTRIISCADCPAKTCECIFQARAYLHTLPSGKVVGVDGEVLAYLNVAGAVDESREREKGKSRKAVKWPGRRRK